MGALRLKTIEINMVNLLQNCISVLKPSNELKLTSPSRIAREIQPVSEPLNCGGI
jgi:hypothetical protein